MTQVLEKARGSEPGRKRHQSIRAAVLCLSVQLSLKGALTGLQCLQVAAYDVQVVHLIFPVSRSLTREALGHVVMHTLL